MSDSKACLACREIKPVDGYSRNRRKPDGREPYCKTCRSAMARGEDPRVPDPDAPPPAPPGHKRCARCKRVHPVGEFGRDRRRSDGLYPYCRGCKSKTGAESHARHKEARKPRRKAYYEANKTRILDARRVYYEANARRIAQTTAAYRRRRIAEDKGVRVYSFTNEQLVARLAYFGNRCWMCKGPAGAVDHVKPMNLGGPHMLANIRPACASCNPRKADLWPYVAMVAVLSRRGVIRDENGPHVET